ncbi:DUF423 domain-containing protein [Caldalkalibacillus salinus]|uniref:DUF423 domain-containing protein n=1 Tax=Caldalkalibacillus salinus TaxID=2803787 RepID=UPI001924C32F|nr:DUF423 domain-containing protein [Caldalkalibacillus salinus]
MMKLFVLLGSINAFLTVALGAFGAHGLKGKLSDYHFEVFQTGVQYHMMHAIGLILVGILAQWLNPNLLNWAGWTLLIGIILFSGSLYTLAMTGIGKLGAITPIGGLAFLIGWVLVAMAALK